MPTGPNDTNRAIDAVARVLVSTVIATRRAEGTGARPLRCRVSRKGCGLLERKHETSHETHRMSAPTCMQTPLHYSRCLDLMGRLSTEAQA